MRSHKIPIQEEVTFAVSMSFSFLTEIQLKRDRLSLAWEEIDKENSKQKSELQKRSFSPSLSLFLFSSFSLSIFITLGFSRIFQLDEIIREQSLLKVSLSLFISLFNFLLSQFISELFHFDFLSLTRSLSHPHYLNSNKISVMKSHF